MMSQFRTVIGTLLWPSRAFADLLQKPTAWIAVLLLVATLIAAHAVKMHRMDFEALRRAAAEQIGREPGKSSKEVAEEDIEKEATRTLNMQRIFGYLLITVLTPMGVLIPAVLFWFGCRFSAQTTRRGRFKSCYAVSAHVLLPYAARCLLSIPVILSYPGIDPGRKDALFKSDLFSLLGQNPPFPGAFLLDVFWVWTAALFFLAGRAAGWGRIKAGAAGVILWLMLGAAGQVLL